MTVQTHEDLWGQPPDFRRDRMAVAFVTSLVSMVMDVPVQDIVARRRTTAAGARARQTAIYLAHVVLAWPLWKVAAAFGRDRSTASHAIHAIEDLRDDTVFDERLTVMEACVRQASESQQAAA